MSDSLEREQVVSPPSRLLALDVFRGFDVAAMLLVNMTWDRAVFHRQLFHVTWNDPLQGATFTDLVFPWFLFIAGCAIPFSLASGRGRGQSSLQHIRQAAWRGATLYLLGVLLTVAGQAHQTPLQWSDLFRWNILQLIGAAYFIAVCVVHLPRSGQIAFVILVLLVKASLVQLLPADYVRGVLEQDGLAARAVDAPQGTATFVHFDDIKRFLNYEHITAGGSAGYAARWIGWLGMAQQFLPCAVIAIVGAWCGQALQRQRLAPVVAIGLGALLIGHVLQGGYEVAGGGWLGAWTMPYSKWLFSPAYCLLSAGSGALLLAGWYLVCDRWRFQCLPLQALGRNALAIYLAAELSFKLVLARWLLVQPDGSTGSLASGILAWLGELPFGDWFAGTVFVVAWILLWTGCALSLARRNITIRV